MKQVFEHLNFNSIRKYPLHEANIDSDILTDAVLVDAQITVPNTVTQPVYVSSIYVTNAICSIGIKDGLGNTLGVATGSLTNEDYNSLYIQPIVQFVTGVIVVGREVFDIPSKFGMAKQTLVAEEGELEARCINIVTPSAVSSLTVNGIKLTGDIKIIAGSNYVVGLDDEVDNGIVLSLINPEAFIPECLVGCDPGQCNGAILSINDVLPDVTGNININGDGVVVPAAVGTQVIIDTPLVSTQDLCKEKNVGRPGPPGPIGPIGPQGPAGVLTCGEADCLCQVCDVEVIPEDCDPINELP